MKSSRYFKFFFYQTNDGGAAWERIDYDRREPGAYENIIKTFLENAPIVDATAIGVYHHANGKKYETGRNDVKISNNVADKPIAYPLPQLPDQRRMLRTLHFVDDHQGYIFGGNLKEPSQGYIIETLDGGRSWKNLKTDLPHIHYSVKMEDQILLAGKNSLLKKWTPESKEKRSLIHTGSTARILIDGNIEKDEWLGANKTGIEQGIDLYTLQDEHFIYLSIQYDTAFFKNYYADLYVELGQDTLLNIHASQQLGERILVGADWDDTNPAFAWGYISNWTANKIKFDRKNKVYLPYTALEFQIAKSKLPKDMVKLALQTRDLNWEKAIINLPKKGNFTSTQDWLLLFWK